MLRKTFSSIGPKCYQKLYLNQIRNSSKEFLSYLDSELKSISEAGLYKNERIITSPQSSEISVLNLENNVINFCANNYLGLSNNNELINSAKQGLDTYGLGLSSVRFICGTQDIHKQLESSIAKFHNKEDAILYPSCFDANTGIFECLLNDKDAIISDKLNHASIIDGIRLCKAKRYLHNHLDLNELEECFKKSLNERNRLYVTDGCFSMDGDIAPLDKIVELGNKYNVMIMIDECHATGFLGKTGRGTEEYHNTSVDIINSTLGKALGGATGGYTTGPKQVIDMLRQRSRPYLFSNALAPSLVTSSIKVFELISNDTSLRDKLELNTKRFRQKMKDCGFKLMGDPSHPIAPVMLGDAKLAQLFAQDMLLEGIYVIGFSYPVVPKGEARIRVQLSGGHTFSQIDKCVDAFVKIAKKHNVLSTLTN